MFGLDFGFAKSKQHSESFSGLRGTPQFGQFAGNYANLSNQASQQTLGYANSPVNMFQGQTGEQITNTNPLTGLPMAFDKNLASFGNQMFANTSAGGSFRGQNSPENTQGIVGSAMTNMGATLLPYIADWQKYAIGLPEELKKSRLGMYQNTLGSMAPGLGNQSEGSASSMQVKSGINGGGGSLWG